MSTLSFEPERHFVEDAVAASGQTVVSCFLVPEKARDICLQYRKETGHLREIVITRVPDMTQEQRDGPCPASNVVAVVTAL